MNKRCKLTGSGKWASPNQEKTQRNPRQDRCIIVKQLRTEDKKSWRQTEKNNPWGKKQFKGQWISDQKLWRLEGIGTFFKWWKKSHQLLILYLPKISFKCKAEIMTESENSDEGKVREFITNKPTLKWMAEISALSQKEIVKETSEH